MAPNVFEASWQSNEKLLEKFSVGTLGIRSGSYLLFIYLRVSLISWKPLNLDIADILLN